MRALFLISDTNWTGSTRAFVLAARGLSARGHEVLLACESECPVQVRAAEAEIQVALGISHISAIGSPLSRQ